MTTMEEINTEWLKSRIGSDRGIRAELARETGISPDKISKILAGTRQVQASEAPLIYAFFSPNEEIRALSSTEEEILSLLSQLTDQEREYLLNSAKGVLASRDSGKQ